jgi:predicted XRE-type DNA-binding protein
VKIIAEHGAGPEAVYVYWMPSQQVGQSWPCKIGKATNPKKRIASVLSAMQENPNVAIFWCESSFWLEQRLHTALHDKITPVSREWFTTNLDEIREAIKRIEESGTVAAPLGMQMRALRQSKMVSQRQLSDLTGMAQSTISDVERAAVNVTLETVERYLAALGARLSVVAD